MNQIASHIQNNIANIIAESSKDSSTQYLLLLAAVVMGTCVILNMRRRRPLDGSPKQYRREIDSAVGQGASVKRDMERLLVELEELSRKINSQVDTKFAKLEQSISDADRRISAMRILIDECKRVSANVDTPAAAEPQEEDASKESTDSPPDPAVQSPAAPPDPLRQKIYALADEGLSAPEIARQLNEPIGEIELILNLRT